MSEQSQSLPNSRYGKISIVLMLVPILSVVLLTFIFDPFINNLSNTVQRILVVFLLLLPALLGFVFAIVGLFKRESRKWIHIIGLIINLLESLYFGLLVLIAG